jgi:hypothetical protein
MKLMTITRVVNIRTDRYDVYIGNPSIFGNPYSIQKYGRRRCIELFRIYFYNSIRWSSEFKNAVLKLKGKILGCFCRPRLCHGDIIVEYLEKKM